VRVAIYRRISTDEERQPFSLDAQQERLASYVAAQPGWVLARSYSDRMSGKRLDRPGLQQALRDARAGLYELLLVFKVDRLARSTGGLAKVLDELDIAGVAFRSASEPFDTATAAGRMMMQMLGVFAEFEREMIVERCSGSSPCTPIVDSARPPSADCSTTLGSPPLAGDGGPPTASLACCATPPTSGSSPSTASNIRPATSPSSILSCSSGRIGCSPSAGTHHVPRPPTPPTTC
jgi:Resolvase, N terminal domain